MAHAHMYTGAHKQMPLSAEQHQRQRAPHLVEHQIIPFVVDVVDDGSVLHTLRRRWAHGLCKYIYILRSLSLIQNHSAISSHISMCMPLSACGTSRHVYACIHVSSWVGALLQLWCGSRRRAQKTSRLMKVVGPGELFLLSSTRFARRHNTQ